MPSWKIHLIFNLIFLIIVLNFLYRNELLVDPFSIIFLIIFNILATIFPDIDTPKSKIRQYVSLILALTLIFYFIINFSINSFLSLTISFLSIYLFIRFFPTKHRGVTHKLWFSVIFSLGAGFILWFLFRYNIFEFLVYSLVIFIGYLSHLILDRLA